jgi:hypothetical protein
VKSVEMRNLLAPSCGVLLGLACLAVFQYMSTRVEDLRTMQSEEEIQLITKLRAGSVTTADGPRLAQILESDRDMIDRSLDLGADWLRVLKIMSLALIGLGLVDIWTIRSLTKAARADESA